MRLWVTDSFAATGRAAAGIIADMARKKPTALLGCATGGSVTGIYSTLARMHKEEGLDLSVLRTVGLDEYVGLGPEDEGSMAHFLQTYFFGPVGLGPDNRIAFDGRAKSAELEAARVEGLLQEAPIDCLMLGVGTNGHIGFNEPAAAFTPAAHTVALTADTIAANARFFGDAREVPQMAFTLGMRQVVRARQVVLVATGAGKAAAIRGLFASSMADPRLPCSILHLCENVSVIIDSQLAKEAGVDGPKATA